MKIRRIKKEARKIKRLSDTKEKQSTTCKKTLQVAMEDLSLQTSGRSQSENDEGSNLASGGPPNMKYSIEEIPQW